MRSDASREDWRSDTGRTAARGHTIAAMKVCWNEDDKRAVKLAHELWPTEGVEGQLAQELALPSHCEAAAANVTEEMVAEQIACPGPGEARGRHQQVSRGGLRRGLHQPDRPDQEGFFRFYERELRSRLDT